MTGSPPEIPGLIAVQPLGSGGYADVFLYEQQMPRMPVAVKVLKVDGMTSAIRRQFIDEADTMAQLGDHPYIVQVFRADTSADGRPYLVMKYYPPPNLAVRARRERFTVEEVLRTGIQLASAVETAHRAGVIHRDIKPANVLVSQYGAPGLTDFGIAGRGRAVDDDTTQDVGVSVPWAPPEVLFGHSSGGPTSDVYSLAATLWQLLVGRSPFEVPGADNSAYALMPRVRSTPVPSTGRADVPVSLERLLAQAMAKEERTRPQTALDFARGLQDIEQEQRFARTAIVVLDEQGHTTLADQSQAPEGGDADRTRIKAPQAVYGQRSVGAAPAAQPAPLSGGTRIPSSSSAPVDTTHGTFGSTPALGPDVEEGTVRVQRGATAAPASSGATEERRSVTIGPWAIIGALVTMLVVVGVVVAIAIRGNPKAAEPTTTGAGTVSLPATGSQFDIPARPKVSATAAAGKVVFSWSVEGTQAGDEYRYQVANSQDGLGAAQILSSAKDSVTVPATKGALRCLRVQVNRQGTRGDMSDPVCERAQ